MRTLIHFAAIAAALIIPAVGANTQAVSGEPIKVGAPIIGAIASSSYELVKAMGDAADDIVFAESKLTKMKPDETVLHSDNGQPR